ncbi:hypothetical protein B0H17DRAFT_1127044 [Mycena rosella]|uniref:Uncharacterized protein n=1 Tax=Mycena rosella TaxID=1033263 RepID=A0AAD7M6Y3_MYCRO|nr:hypothetical protein B0H17DRAFT_1127044 [Mycena rosella]
MASINSKEPEMKTGRSAWLVVRVVLMKVGVVVSTDNATSRRRDLDKEARSLTGASPAVLPTLGFTRHRCGIAARRTGIHRAPFGLMCCSTFLGTSVNLEQCLECKDLARGVGCILAEDRATPSMTATNVLLSLSEIAGGGGNAALREEEEERY